MTAIKSISIHEPCHEQWVQMKPVIDGRYCLHCCKTVTDFTKMNNADIISYLDKKPNVCGRFDKQQLSLLNNDIGNNNYTIRWKKLLVAASLMSLIPFARAEAGVQHETERHENKKQGRQNSLPADTVGEVLLKGKVIVKDGGLPLPGTSVYLNDKTLTTSTDMDGNFKLIVPSSADSLVFSFIGFKPQKFKIKDVPGNLYNVTMEEDSTIANSANIVAGGVCVRYSFARRVWNKIKRIF
ncbi:carboxypeptidase-like regulatory domain-containing protein [Mucilaginibacter sp. AW1-7]|uniref:carboxypeptidase-like regulatory domain-containing protein n=1 Tax=Mucilaginibacter sp. AW1-7 TaxID=3349874 RepID=UPI003F731753